MRISDWSSDVCSSDLKFRARMQAVMDEVGFKGDLPAFLHFLRTDPQFYAKTPQELLNRAAWIAKRFDGKAAQYFGRLPRSRFAIEPVPDELAPFYTGRSEEHASELQSLMRTSYAVFCLKKKK